MAFRATQVREPDLKRIPAVAEKKGEPAAITQLKEQQANKLIDFYLVGFQKGLEIKYKLYLENDASSDETFQALGHDIPFYLYFDSYMIVNGSVQLKVKSLSIGALGSLIKEVLKFVKRPYGLPKWVETNLNDQTVLLRLDQFGTRGGLFIRVEKINLAGDDTHMNICLSKKK